MATLKFSILGAGALGAGMCLAASAGCVGRAAAGRPSAAKAPASAVLGRPAPAVSLPGDDGRLYTLAGPTGRSTVLLFVCGCPQCLRVARAVGAAVREGAAGADVYGITSMGPGDAQVFRASSGLGSPLLLDSGGATERSYRVKQCPAVWVVDRRGVARAATSLRGATPQQCIAIALAALRGTGGRGGEPEGGVHGTS